MARTTSLSEKDFETNELRVLCMEPSIIKFLMVERIVPAEPSNVTEIISYISLNLIASFLSIRHLGKNLLKIMQIIQNGLSLLNIFNMDYHHVH